MASAISYRWALDAQGAEAKPMQGGSGDVPPTSGTENVAIDQNEQGHAALADSLDAARARLNEIVTCWKDAVGMEPDSTMGRSNQASMTTTEGNDEDEEEEDDDEEDDA